ncbi:MAG TPA: RodZ domain-containing protein [Gaiellaceae bacterium]|nr:RodZ domain-containing protein [Gaiellaceae bacterium]
MFDIGSSLAAAREARGLDLRAAEGLTCMRIRYLEALEADRFDDLPGRTYARAFLRTYAAALGLNADRFVAEFDEQFPEPLEIEDAPAPRRRRRAVPLAAAPIAAVVAIAALLVWSAWSNDHLGRNIASPPPATPANAAVPAKVHAQVRAATKTLVAHPALVVRAVSGSCWVQARRGGPAGAVLAERTLAQGETLRLTAQHVWLRLGAPWNVRVTRGAHALKLAPTTLPANVTA